MIRGHYKESALPFYQNIRPEGLTGMHRGKHLLIRLLLSVDRVYYK